MTLSKQPKKLVVVGSGAIGIEFAHFYNAMGTNVTIVEYLDRIVLLKMRRFQNNWSDLLLIAVLIS